VFAFSQAGAALRRGLTLKPTADDTAQVLTVQPL
jgi:hypothetical protein